MFQRKIISFLLSYLLEVAILKVTKELLSLLSWFYISYLLQVHRRYLTIPSIKAQYYIHYTFYSILLLLSPLLFQYDATTEVNLKLAVAIKMFIMVMVQLWASDDGFLSFFGKNSFCLFKIMTVNKLIVIYINIITHGICK